MSQFGMMMPGGQPRRSASMDVYTGLLGLAVLALLAACIFLWVQGSKVGREGSWWELQQSGQISLQGGDGTARR